MRLSTTKQFSIWILLFGIGIECAAQEAGLMYESETLKIERITEHTFVHISYLTTQDFGKVACNGMIVVDNDEALIFDTPTNDVVSTELIDWVETMLKCKVKGVIINHFHSDCLGGQGEFHNRQIPSYANDRTIALVESGNGVVPKIGFDKVLETAVGTTSVVNFYAGEGHTSDNIVSYYPKDKVLFGGCFIKAMGAGKGNLEDANVIEWPKTVLKVKGEFSDAEIIIPGHGKTGGRDLLDYTIELFRK